MAHFLGEVSGTRGKASRLGTKSSGLETVAASWDGAITVELNHDATTGKDRFTVRQKKWHGHGVSETIAEGVIGEPTRKADGKTELIETLRYLESILSEQSEETFRMELGRIRETLKKAEV